MDTKVLINSLLLIIIIYLLLDCIPHRYKFGESKIRLKIILMKPILMKILKKL